MGVGLLCKKMHSVHILWTVGKKLTVFEIITINGFNGLAVSEEIGWGWSPCDDGNPFLEYSLVTIFYAHFIYINFFFNFAKKNSARLLNRFCKNYSLISVQT